MEECRNTELRCVEMDSVGTSGSVPTDSLLHTFRQQGTESGGSVPCCRKACSSLAETSAGSCGSTGTAMNSRTLSEEERRTRKALCCRGWAERKGSVIFSLRLDLPPTSHVFARVCRFLPAGEWWQQLARARKWLARPVRGR